MSELSPEAKQAAIDIVNRSGANTFDLAEIQDRVQQAIDTATAKLWDEISRLRNALVCIATDDYPEEFVARATEADSARMFAQEQLAHQPSASTAEEPEPLPAKFLREDGKGFVNT